MGELEDKIYDQHAKQPYGEADTLARKILRDGQFITRDVYKYRGNYYTVVFGKVLTREQAKKLDDERQRERRNLRKDHGTVSTR